MIKQHADTIDDFDVTHQAIRNTEWRADPADPVNLTKGALLKGDLIWFHPDHFGSGPTWLQARLPDSTLGYVHLADFKRV
jgi:hypothetical protein